MATATLNRPKRKSAPAIPEPPQVICLDIETGYASAEEIEKRIREWEPPGNVKKDATIDQKRKEFAENARELSALWDAAPILCVAVATASGLVGFDGMQATGGKLDRHGNAVIRCGEEKRMLTALRDFLDLWNQKASSVLIVGQNIKGFDLPKLRMAYVRERLALPGLLRVVRDDEDERVKIVDLMNLFAYNFSLENRPEVGKTPYVSFKTIMRYLDMPPYPDGFDAASCPSWAEQKQFDLVLDKAMVDARDEYRAYLLLSSRAEDLQ